MALAFASILVNLGYGQTVNDVIGAGTMAWMAAETRQAGNAAGEFAAPLLLAGAQAVLAIALFVAARAALRRGGWDPRGWQAGAGGLALLLAPSLLAGALGLPASAAERNLYSLGLEVALAEPPPPRAPVDLEPDLQGSPRAIVWLVDESIAYRQFHEILAPRLAEIAHVDFGMAAALGHCSAPANLALRSGVDVRHAGPALDLRRTPSIWGYARKAGYRTVLIDGQTSGAPQNLLLPPERALIDEVVSAAGGMDTDARIAGQINRMLRSGQRTFVYAVLRGVHFQYRDHFPAGLIPADSPTLLPVRDRGRPTRRAASSIACSTASTATAWRSSTPRTTARTSPKARCRTAARRRSRPSCTSRWSRSCPSGSPRLMPTRRAPATRRARSSPRR